MQTRPCGKTGIDLTIIGYGAMRIHGPDVEAWAALVREAADLGLNYFEAGNAYCSFTCETKVGLGLKGFPRDKVCVSTKSSLRNAPTADAIRRCLDESLKRLGMDYVDFYQIWGLSWKSFNEIASKPDGTLEGIRAAQKEGLIRHVGFTTHDKPEGIINVLRTGEFESVTLVYNALDRCNEPAIAEAGSLGVGVIAMSPLWGGLLASDSPLVRDVLGKGLARTTAEAAFRFILSNPHVTCAPSGAVTSGQLRDNARIATEFKPLTEGEKSEVERALAALKAQCDTLCTGCRYCMPCPQGVGISEIFRLANAARIYGLSSGARRDYALFSKDWPYEDYKDATHCTECGECLDKCPQKIDIPAELKKAHETLK